MASHSLSRRSYLAGAAGTISVFSGCTAFGNAGSGGTITIGTTVPETGSFSALGKDLKQGYNLGIQRMNEEDGIRGNEVELVIEDDESDPEVVRQKLQQIVSNNEVDMLWGSFSSLLVPAGSAFAEQEELPFISIAASYEKNRIESNADWTFIPFPHSRDMARGTLNILKQIPDSSSRVAIWEPNSGWGKEMADAWEQNLKNAGYEIVYRGRYSIGADDFSSLISRTAESKADILLSNPTPVGGITAMQQMSSSNYTPKFIEFIRAADPFAWWSALKASGRAVCMAPGWVPGMTGNGNSQLYEKYQPQSDAPNNEYPPVMVGASYNLTQVAEQALRNADSNAPEDIQKILQERTFKTVIGKFGFDDVGRPKKGQLKVPIGQWWDGQQRLVSSQTDHPASMKLKYPIKPWNER